MQPIKVQRYFEKYLIYMIGISMALGIIFGLYGLQRYRKNVSLAVGLAAQFFSPLTVAMLAINPLVQAPAMAWFLRWSRKNFNRKDQSGV